MSVKVAVVGAGPSGCYLAQALRKSLPDSNVTMLDRLPIPFGLVRYGVAPDHQGTKAITKQFARLFEREGVAFLGNVELGRHVNLDDLLELFDIVVLATGLSADKTLGPEFTDVPCLYGAGDLTRLWNGHPDQENFLPDLGDTTCVIGNGNVAMDIVRLLAKGAEDFDGSDIKGEAISTSLRHIHLIGRSPADKAKFDAAMTRELGKIAGVTVDMATPLPADTEDKGLMELHALAGKAGTGGKTLSFHFDTSPVRPILQGGRTTGLACERNGEETIIPCDSIVTAIGFDGDDTGARGSLLATAIDRDSGQLADRLFATGWYRRGATGTIAANRADAKAVAARIVDVVTDAPDGTRSGLAGLRERLHHQTTDYADWLAIDVVERQMAPPHRVRSKLTTRADMLAVCTERKA
ncbi:MAG: FAD-dependent oxidoreductase [Pseudomonadota bacterium]